MSKLPFSAKINTFAAILLLAGAMAAMAAKVPRPLADVSIDIAGGKRIKLIDGRGKIRMIAILTTDCEHCASAVAAFNKVERTFRAQGVQVIGAAVNADAPQRMKEFQAKTKPSFPIGTMTQDSTRLLADFTVNDRPFVPIVLFVDKNNFVKYQFFGDSGFFTQNTEASATGILNVLLKQQ